MGKDIARPLNTVRGESVGIGTFDNPLDFIAEDHMREREVCALIDRIVASAPMEEAERDQILAFLEVRLPQHLADEEIDLFPLMLKRCDPEDEIEAVIGKLQSDHGHALADAPTIFAIIQGLDTNSPKPTRSEAAQMAEFAHHARRHLILENAVILPIARARLTGGDLNTMKRHMLERRGLCNTGKMRDAE
ncbi:hemerythrin domain-containing protein [uncultured Roseovarius sp.]|uniref:hemerythrin domain-containing protein n=1 Tax=Roseovarius sp. TaxID=1486281 RepID=UPI0025DE4591|nr:hemerythrin domain-containing protein [uncultured Roseovarius sp.]